ncbi:MAG: DNA gyrase subunit A [Oligoflexales bacterium]
MSTQQNVVPVSIESEMRTSFLDYSMSVIVSRALPDVRDGLKPVHRRILYAMHGLKNYSNKPYMKSARVVGDVIGKYHPHGDKAVYDALVRLAQEFSMRYPLVDGQGNFGSIDGDSAAAMRYTECRMQSLSEKLLDDLDKDTIDFVPNYDNKDVEPEVMPARYPQLLVNGASGIAVGMATNIPPHNLSEIVDAVNALIDNSDISISELMEYVKGPDFPTYGAIHGLSGIKDAYETGRGSILIRGKAEVVEQESGRERIIITEIPYQVNKARLIEKIAELVRDKKLEGISDLRDESSKDGIRVVVEIKRQDSGDIVLNHLYKMTQLQTTFGVNLLGLVKGTPKLLNLKDMLREFYDHRRDVVLRRTAFLLRKSEARAHVLLGLKVAVENADPVIELIRKSSNTEEAQRELMLRFELDEIQAKAILDMRLAKLTGLEREKIVKEHDDLMVEIKDFKDILATPSRVTEIIREELKEIKDEFGDGRRTVVVPHAAGDFTMESLVSDDPVIVTITQAGYVKRTPLVDVQAQRRGGKGRSGMLTKSDDFVSKVFTTSNHQNVLCFTNVGRVFNLKVYQFPESPLRARGKHLSSLIPLDDGEAVVSSLPIKEFVDDQYVLSVTRNGYIKKTDLMAYSNVRSTGIIGLKLDDNDSLVNCQLSDGTSEVLLATRMGKAIRFPESEVRPMGRASRGVTGIRFQDEEDAVIAIEVVSADSEMKVLTVCEAGFGKRSELSEYRTQSRGGKGVYTIRVSERNGPVVGMVLMGDDDQLVIMTSAGNLVRFRINQVSVVGRHTQGVNLVRVADDEQVISVGRVAAEDCEDEENEEDHDIQTQEEGHAAAVVPTDAIDEGSED